MLLTIQELLKAQCNNTDYSDTDPFLSVVGQERPDIECNLNCWFFVEKTSMYRYFWCGILDIP